MINKTRHPYATVIPSERHAIRAMTDNEIDGLACYLPELATAGDGAALASLIDGSYPSTTNGRAIVYLDSKTAQAQCGTGYIVRRVELWEIAKLGVPFYLEVN